MSRARLVLAIFVPLALLAALLGYYRAYGAGPLTATPAPIEEVAFERVIFEPGQIRAQLRNVGPNEVTIATVMVNEAIWDYAIAPRRTFGRFGSAEITIPYDWQAAQPYTITVVTSTGLPFDHTTDIAVESPRPSLRTFASFGLLGITVGVLPVFIGLLWFPVLRAAPVAWTHGLLAFTVGLLVWLGADAFVEAFEAGNSLPDVYRGSALAIGIAVLTFLAVGAAGSRAGLSSPLTLAYMIATGIGLHNLGEGLAIGSAYVLGKVALGTSLVVGFTIHNTTEGLAIIGPLSRQGAKLRHWVLLGCLAGVPTIAGTWIGGFTYSRLASVVFLAAGAGAIFQVVAAVAKYLKTESPDAWTSRVNVAAFAAGLAVMYMTALLV